MTPNPDDLEPKIQDDLADLAEALIDAIGGVASAFPDSGVGPLLPFLSKYIVQQIPNRQMDRVVRFLKEFYKLYRVTELSTGYIMERLEEPKISDLLEEGIYQAARAIDPGHVEQIATMVKNGFTADVEDAVAIRSLLTLRAELNESEIIILRRYAIIYPEQEGVNVWDRAEEGRSFEAQHHELFGDSFGRLLGTTPSYENESLRDKRALYRNFYLRLQRLGLLTQTGTEMKATRSNGLAHGNRITDLGYLLLKTMDLA